MKILDVLKLREEELIFIGGSIMSGKTTLLKTIQAEVNNIEGKESCFISYENCWFGSSLSVILKADDEGFSIHAGSFVSDYAILIVDGSQEEFTPSTLIKLKSIALREKIPVVISFTTPPKTGMCQSLLRMDDVHLQEINKIADKVYCLHRRELYDPMDKPNQVEILCTKNRSTGKPLKVVLHFDPESGEYEHLQTESISAF